MENNDYSKLTKEEMNLYLIMKSNNQVRIAKMSLEEQKEFERILIKSARYWTERRKQNSSLSKEQQISLKRSGRMHYLKSVSESITGKVLDFRAKGFRENTKMESLLLGVAVGDALGVPVEFKSRESLRENPVIDMIGYGTHNQPPGTWSDDSALTFCLAENLGNELGIRDLAERFIKWYDHGYWTPYGVVFDVGISTSKSIQLLKQGIDPRNAGGKEEWENGNGSLMRILPLAYFLLDIPPIFHFDHVKDISSVTHAHPRSILSCYIYITLAIQLFNGVPALKAFNKMQEIVNQFLEEKPSFYPNEEKKHFYRLLHVNGNTWRFYPENEIRSSGYVIDTLEAALWCLLTTDNYKDAVLKAVNLGEDTDTTGAVTGGLAGILYGITQIPDNWLGQLARRSDISYLAANCFAGWSQSLSH